MNILPKKRWHVRTKDNIARVRRDEAEAREKEDKRLEKLKIAESEARINFLRRQNGIPERLKDDVPSNNLPETTEPTAQGHIDLFSDFKTHTKIKNKDLEREKKEQREKYEKQIGYLTYLGQDTNEALKVKSWYEVAPKRGSSNSEETEKDPVNKYFNDPLTLIHTLLPSERFEKESKPAGANANDNESVCQSNESVVSKSDSKNHKKEKKSKKKKSKKEKHGEAKREKHRRIKEYIEETGAGASIEQKRHLIERLRKERLQREAAERERQYELLNPSKRKRSEVKKSVPLPRVKQKYNSQFNPDLAKQNIMD